MLVDSCRPMNSWCETSAQCKLELSMPKWEITKTKGLCLGLKFTVYTDNNLLITRREGQVQLKSDSLANMHSLTFIYNVKDTSQS